MAGSITTRESRGVQSSLRALAPANATQASTRVLWLGRDAVPSGVAQVLTNASCTVCERSSANWPAQRVAWLAQVSAAARVHRSLRGRRIAVVHPDPGASDALAEALRARGAQVVVLSLGEAGLDRAEALDPEVVVMQPDHLAGSGLEVIESVWRHPRLRWTPLLFVPHSRLGSAGASAPNVRELAIGVNLLCGEYEALVRRVGHAQPFDLALHELGPMRTLRALLETTGPLRARFETSDLTIEVDLGEGLIIGAQGGLPGCTEHERLLGVHAISALQTQTNGKVSVWQVEHPAVTNIMAPLEAMLLGQHAAPALADTSTRLSVSSAPPVAALSAHDAFDSPTNQRALPAGLRAQAANENGKATVPAATEAPNPNIAALSRSSALPAPSQVALVQAARARIPGGQAKAPPPTPPARAASKLPPPVPTSLAPRANAPVMVAPPASMPEPPNRMLPLPLDPWPLPNEPTVPPLPVDIVHAHATIRGKTWQLASALVALGTLLACIALFLRHSESSSLPRTQLPVAHAVAVPATAAPLGATPIKASAVEQTVLEPNALKPAVLAPAPANPVADSPEEQPEVESTPSVAERPALLRQASRLVGAGHQLRRQGKYDAARATYAEAAKVYPRYPRAIAGLAEAYLALGDKARALEAARAVVQLRPRFADDHRLLGDAQRLNGRMQEARSAWQHAASLGNRTARDRLKLLD